MSRIILIFCFLSFTQNVVLSQSYIKNSGIKTSLSARNQLEKNDTTYENHHQTDIYNGKFIPAEYYQPNVPFAQPQDLTVGMSGYTKLKLVQDYVLSSTIPPPLDPIAAFINKTRTEMESGVCYNEVPTSSLVHKPNVEIIGNGTTPDLSRIHVCCPGYERNPHIYLRCEPICENDCQNGICVAPNKCVCLPGTVLDAEGNCLTTCPVGCSNGNCGENGECHCKFGYKLEPHEKKYCIPHCEQNCIHGRCASPNVCACEKGYRLNIMGTCEPICENCADGRCTAPGVCLCDEGYKNVKGLCEPICTKGCGNGICIRPETCECSDNLIFDVTKNKCVPYCEGSCQNGYCTGHNTCTCDAGYIQNPDDWSVCNPVCSHGCPQGYCFAPNVCHCNPGFTKTGIKGRTYCIKA